MAITVIFKSTRSSADTLFYPETLNPEWGREALKNISKISNSYNPCRTISTTRPDDYTRIVTTEWDTMDDFNSLCEDYDTSSDDSWKTWTVQLGTYNILNGITSKRYVYNAAADSISDDNLITNGVKGKVRKIYWENDPD